MKFYPYEKGGGAEKVLAMLKGATTSFGVALSFSHIEDGVGGAQTVSTL